MTIRVVFIRWTFSIFETKKNQKRRKNVCRGFNSISNQGIRMTKDTCQTFDQCKCNISKDAEIGRSYGRLFAIYDLCQNIECF